MAQMPTLPLVAALAAVALCAADALPACDGHDVGQVSQRLLYTGPNQHVKKDRGRHGSSVGNRCFHGQHWEDLYMFQHFLHGVGSGFFIELGALDGYSYSITYYFEIFQKWKGLLIEASPQNHALFAARTRKAPRWQRRTVPYVQAAVCADPKPLTYVSKEGTGAGILEFMSTEQQARNRAMCKAAPPPAPTKAAADPTADDAKPRSSDCILTPIQCVNLAGLFKEKGVTHVDLFVLDVEGAELEVISTLDFAATPVRYFLIELDGQAGAKDAKVRCVLRRNGYVPIGRLDLNEVWTHPSFPHDRFAASYSNISDNAWRRCFVGSHVDFLKPVAAFGKPGGGAALTESANVVTDEPLDAAPPAQRAAGNPTVAPRPVQHVIDDAHGVDDTWVVLGAMAVVASIFVARRRGYC